MKKNTSLLFLLLALVLTFASVSAEAKGRKFGLFIGINDYPETIGALSGCVNDAKKMQKTLATRYGFKLADTTLLLNADATRQGIIDQIKKYEAMAGEGDLFVIHYSGHGSLFPDSYSEERDETEFVYFEDPNTGKVIYPRDKYDATLVPVDADEETSGKPWRNEILDDELFALFSGFTKKGAQVVFISDSCFSGSIAKAEAVKTKMRFAPINRIFGTDSFEDIKFTKPPEQKTVNGARPMNNLYITLTGANVNETASDGAPKAEQMGLFTENLVKALNSPGANRLTYEKLMKSVSTTVKNSALKVQHNQNPQLEKRFGNINAVIFSVPRISVNTTKTGRE